MVLKGTMVEDVLKYNSNNSIIVLHSKVPIVKVLVQNGPLFKDIRADIISVQVSGAATLATLQAHI